MKAMKSLFCALAVLSQAAVAESYGALEFSPCTLGGKDSAFTVEARCTKMLVAENPAQADGKQIELAIAWVKSESPNPQADPIFMIAGGPGQSALESYPSASGAFERILRKRHVMLVDQRGTGGSHPLNCKDESGGNAFTDSGDESLVTAADFAKKCLGLLDADPRFYTTNVAIDDLELVRKALGVSQLNLLGVSYGTRVAQEYVRRYPDSIRSVVLDSVVPATLMLGNEHAANLETALDLHFSRCKEEKACTKNLGQPRKLLNKLMTQLKAEPKAVQFRDAITGATRNETLRAGNLAVVMRLYAYNPLTASLLPLLLAEADQGRWDGLAAQSFMLAESLGDAIHHGMQLSVMCSEDAARLQARDEDKDSVLGNSLIDFSKAQCADWPKGEVPKDFHDVLISDKPILVLSGEFDPVTPPRYGDEVVKHFKNGRHLVLRGQGHSVASVGCTPELLGKFLDTNDAAKLDAGCLNRLNYTPPFTGFYGWEP